MKIKIPPQKKKHMQRTYPDLTQHFTSLLKSWTYSKNLEWPTAIKSVHTLIIGFGYFDPDSASFF